METHLTIKHLAGYLPYGLNAIMTVDAREEFAHLEIDNYYIFDKDSIWTYCGYADKDLYIPLGEGEINGFIFRNENSYADIQDFCKPILRPLSDLTKEIEVNGEKFVPKDWLKYNYIGENLGTNMATWSHRTVQKLCEWHFDIHGLIENDLAIDINTLNKT